MDALALRKDYLEEMLNLTYCFYAVKCGFNVDLSGYASELYPKVGIVILTDNRIRKFAKHSHFLTFPSVDVIDSSTKVWQFLRSIESLYDQLHASLLAFHSLFWKFILWPV